MTSKIRRTTAARQRLQEGLVGITTHGQRDASKDKDRLIHEIDNESNSQYEQHPDGCSSDEPALLIVRGNCRGDLKGLRSHRQSLGDESISPSTDLQQRNRPLGPSRNIEIL